MIPIPIGSQHTARTVETFDVPHTCASCGVLWTLRLRAAGEGHAFAPLLASGTEAQSQARTTATYDAQANARSAVAFSSCPACHRSLVPPQRHWLIMLMPAFLILTAVGLGVPVALTFLFQENVSEFYGVLVAVGSCAIVLHTRMQDRTRALDAAKTIRWFRGEPPDKPFVGCACKTCEEAIASVETGERCPECGAPTHHDDCARDHALAAHGPEGEAAYRGKSV